MISNKKLANPIALKDAKKEYLSAYQGTFDEFIERFHKNKDYDQRIYNDLLLIQNRLLSLNLSPFECVYAVMIDFTYIKRIVITTSDLTMAYELAPIKYDEFGSTEYILWINGYKIHPYVFLVENDHNCKEIYDELMKNIVKHAEKYLYEDE